jgi:hypothetical protein
MLPSLLTPPSDAPVDVPPPPGFRAAEGVRSARLETKIVDLPPRGASFAQRSGLRYEAKVHAALAAALGEAFYKNPWMSFEDSSGWRRCRPDGLAVCDSFAGRGLVIIFEIKIRHMPEAWWQLRRLYEPVVEQAFPRREIRVVEIVRSFDPSMPFPERPTILSTLEESWTRKTLPELAVFEWKQ